MLSARTVIIIVVLLVVVSVVGTVVSMLGTPDSNGLAADTYGTRAHGYRAIFEILQALNVTDERALKPPGAALDPSATLVLWAPQEELVSDEPVYLQQVASWVRGGGRVVVGIGKPVSRASKLRRSDNGRKETSAAEELGIVGVRTYRVDLPGAAAATGNSPAQSGGGNQTAPAETDSDAEGTTSDDFADFLIPQLFVPHRVAAQGEGSLAAALPSAAHLDLPERFQALDIGDSEPTGRIMVDGETPLVLAAQYQLGAGEVILVSEPRIFDNRLISHFDNSVLAVRLFAGSGGPVVWDEFYHGLTIRGSILFLLTRGAYALITVMVSIVLAAWLWRQWRFLGPPRVVLPPSRRTVREYVEAMARFFRRGAQSRRFMLVEVRRGVLWTLRHRIGVRPGFGPPPLSGGAEMQTAVVETQPRGAGIQPSGTGQRPIGPVQRPAGTDQEMLEALIAALTRHDPQAGRQLRDAMARADRIVSGGPSVGEREILEAVKGLADCL